MTTELTQRDADGVVWQPPPLGGAPLRVTPVDAVALENRAARLRTRSIKREAKSRLLDLTIRVMDLTTLEGADTPGKVRSLCAKALRPDPTDPSTPAVAAVCVYPALVPVAVDALTGSTVKIASVAGAFPAGLSRIDVQLADIEAAVEAGAHEVDMVLNRSAFLSGRYKQAFDEITQAKDAAGDAKLKVILETGELGSYDAIRRASVLAMLAGADVIKTSTGKIGAAATPATALVMAEAIRDAHEQTGHVVGLKLAGGIRTAKDAWHYAVIVGETLGVEWLVPERFRIGASSLLDDVLKQRHKLATGRYGSPRDVTVA